ncbi:ABC transporter permease [Mycoplasmopsis caviae]|uniref:ABC transporter permease n=1 Tax=Mycoplasmopsis caviae TaxID=55603 RepID=A0A3P8LI38_9BACT|nr:ABC transporter permease [Mycoplasmopsis caviae]UUD35235.1 ABC transporter permease [Mycoplasmopsis caviae]VDR41982.1 ABC-type transport system involved in multi-copper enzyme maturation, permease component [Mycoplasmopsis caviae]
MRAFFNLQLKIYFRHASSYVVPLVFGLFFILINGILKISSPSAEIFEKLLYSINYLNNINHFSIFMIFIVATFVCQTVFYKYKNEGVDYILYSKPISRTQIYFANVLVCLIGLLFSVAIIELGYFISRFIYPVINVSEIFQASASHLLAISLSAFFALGIASLIHSSVGIRIFQILIGAIPFLITTIFGVVKFAWSTDNIRTVTRSTNNVIAMLPAKEKSNTKFINKLKNKINKNEPILMSRYNDDLRNVLLNISNESEDLTSHINDTHKSIYNYLFWLNIENYFSKQAGAFDHRINALNKKINYYSINPLKNDGTLDYELFKKYGYNLENNITFNIWNVEYTNDTKSTIKQVNSKNVFGVSYDAISLQNKLNSNLQSKSFLYSAIYKTYKEEKIEPILDKLKLFENLFIDTLYKKVENIDFSVLPYTINYEGKKVLVLSKLVKELLIIKNHLEKNNNDLSTLPTNILNNWSPFLNQFNKQKIDELSGFFNNSATLLTKKPSKPKANANISEKIKYQKESKEYHKKLEENKDLIKKAGYLLALLYGINKEEFVISYQTSNDNLDELNALEEISKIELIKLTPLDRDLIVVTRKEHMSLASTIVISILASSTMIAGGWAIFIRRNFK